MRLDFATRLVSQLWRKIFGHRSHLLIKDVEELPDRIKSGTVYLVGEGGYLWYAAMLCPCGCGETLHMNLMPHSRPQWNVTKHPDATLSLHPSVWRLTGCRSHFFVRRGRIVWS
jgi:hypothetical protein